MVGSVAAVLLAVVALVALIGPAGGLRQLLEPGRAAAGADALRSDAWRVGVALLAALAGLAGLVAQRPRSSPALAAGLGLVALCDLFVAHRGLNPTAPPEPFLEPPPLVQLVKQAGARRLLVFDYTTIVGKTYRRASGDALIRLPEEPLARALASREYPQNPVFKLWGLDGSYDMDLLGLYPRPLRQLVFVERASEETPGFLRLLRMGGVDVVAALHSEGLEELELVAEHPTSWGATVRIFRVPQPLRVHTVGRSLVAAGRQAFDLLATPGFDPAVGVLLERAVDPETPGGFKGTARLVEWRPDRLRVEAELSGPGYIVLAEAYDPGWRATLDGRPVPVRRANVAFRAVAAPAGRHVLEMTYRPATVIAGLALSASGLLLLALLLLRLRASSEAAPAGR